MEVIFIYMIHSYFDHKRLGKIIKKCALASHNTYFLLHLFNYLDQVSVIEISFVTSFCPLYLVDWWQSNPQRA